jgi:hypothetical protein
MKYPRLYTSLDEFERMELRNGSTGWRAGEFFEEVLDECNYVEDFEDEEEEDY